MKTICCVIRIVLISYLGQSSLIIYLICKVDYRLDSRLTRIILLVVYDRKRLKGRLFDRTFSDLLFCQTQIFRNVLSKMWFCQNKAKNVLSRIVEFLSNTGGYFDSVLFCQSLQSCLTEHFWCLTEILSRARFV